MLILVGLKAQSELGWDQIFCGRITQYFQDNHDKFIPTCNANWNMSVVYVPWTGFSNLRDLHNASLHGDSLTTKQQQLLICHQQDLKDLYAKQHFFPQDTRLFLNSVESHLDHHGHPQELQNWIQMAMATARASVQRSQRNITCTTTQISTYFHHVLSSLNLQDNNTTRQKNKKKKKVPYKDTLNQCTLPQLFPNISIPKLKPQEMQHWVPLGNSLTQNVYKDFKFTLTTKISEHLFCFLTGLWSTFFHDENDNNQQFSSLKDRSCLFLFHKLVYLTKETRCVQKNQGKGLSTTSTLKNGVEKRCWKSALFCFYSNSNRHNYCKWYFSIVFYYYIFVYLYLWA